MTSSEIGMCFYCKEYYQVTKDYPLNEATYEVDTLLHVAIFIGNMSVVNVDE